MPLIDAGNYPSIRRALRVGLDAESLPDEVLADPLYVPAAINWVEAIVPDAEAQVDPALGFLKLAAILEAASMLCDIMPDLIRQQWGPLQVEASPTDWQAKKVQLHQRALREINNARLAGVSTDAETPPSMFTAAAGTRGRIA